MNSKPDGAKSMNAGRKPNANAMNGNSKIDISTRYVKTSLPFNKDEIIVTSLQFMSDVATITASAVKQLTEDQQNNFSVREADYISKYKMQLSDDQSYLTFQGPVFNYNTSTCFGKDKHLPLPTSDYIVKDICTVRLQTEKQETWIDANSAYILLQFSLIKFLQAVTDHMHCSTPVCITNTPIIKKTVDDVRHSLQQSWEVCSRIWSDFVQIPLHMVEIK